MVITLESLALDDSSSLQFSGSPPYMETIDFGSLPGMSNSTTAIAIYISDSATGCNLEDFKSTIAASMFQYPPPGGSYWKRSEPPSCTSSSLTWGNGTTLKYSAVSLQVIN